MYCSLDKLDLLATAPSGEVFGVQTDARAAAELEAERALSTLFALARVLNAREHLRMRGELVIRVSYARTDPSPPPPWLVDALAAAGARVTRPGADLGADLEVTARAFDAVAVGELVDEAFAQLAVHAAARIGSRDPAMALRMLEDQTLAAPPVRAEDERAYWERVLWLAALTGELLRGKLGGRWVETVQAVVPFAFQLGAPTSGVAEMFPTNRAQRFLDTVGRSRIVGAVEGGGGAIDEHGASLFELVWAAEETVLHPPDMATGRLMPSLRARASIELADVVWRELADDDVPTAAPIVVCGVDGEVTFGMMRRETLGTRTAAEVFERALANLAHEVVEEADLPGVEQQIVVVSGSFYAAEKVLDRAYLEKLQAALGSDALAVAMPGRGELFVSPDTDDGVLLARFAAIVRARYAEMGHQQISACVLLVEEGRIVLCVPAEPERILEPAVIPEAAPAPTAGRVGLWRRFFGRP